MKSLFTLLFCLLFFQAWSQLSYNHLDINQINARVYAEGELFWDLISKSEFEAPKGTGKTSIFAGALWMGGLDNSGRLRVSAQTYRQRGTDFSTGLLKISDGTTDSSAINYYNKVWKINKTTIDSFGQWYYYNLNYPGYSIPSSIQDWPGNGNTSAGYSQKLAPFHDENGNGVYEPTLGDYPQIKGDQALFYVYNDNGSAHGESGGLPLGVEIRALAYAYNCNDSAMSNTIFFDYQIINRSSNEYHDVYIGTWIDFDLGDWLDDKIGCDVNRNTFYVYNSTNQDGTGQLFTYGSKPPAQAVVILESPANKPMTNFLAWANDWSPYGNPDSASNFYNQMRSIFNNGNHLTYGGQGRDQLNPHTNYMFSGFSDTTGGKLPWFNPSYVEHGIAGSGPFNLSPNQDVNYKIAFVFGRDYSANGTNMTSLDKTMSYVDTIRSRFINGNLGECSSPASVRSELSIDINGYPNPTTGLYHIKAKDILLLEVYDSNGRLIQKLNDQKNEQDIDLSGSPNGLYLINVITGTGSKSIKVIKN